MIWANFNWNISIYWWKQLNRCDAWTMNTVKFCDFPFGFILLFLYFDRSAGSWMTYKCQLCSNTMFQYWYNQTLLEQFHRLNSDTAHPNLNDCISFLFQIMFHSFSVWFFYFFMYLRFWKFLSMHFCCWNGAELPHCTRILTRITVWWSRLGWDNVYFRADIIWTFMKCVYFKW